MFIKSGYGGTGQGHGMPCPCENMVAQIGDIERKNSIFMQNSAWTVRVVQKPKGIPH
jgi:hypothetical protein